MYDLIVKGGTVVDPSQNLHGISNIAIENGKIAKIAADIPDEEAEKIQTVRNAINYIKARSK